MAISSLEIGGKTIMRLAEALGLAGQRILAVQITARVNEITKVKVEMVVDVPGVLGTCAVLKEYRLEPIPIEEPGESAPTPVKFREFT